MRRPQPLVLGAQPAKNAGTSVEQIERFYARNLPLSKEMAKNLQSFGERLDNQ